METTDFDRFARREIDGLLRYAVMLSGDRELARDLVQDVLLEAHQKWDRVSAADHPQAYVRTMLTRAFLSRRRRWSTRNVHVDADPEGRPEPDHAPAQVRISGTAEGFGRPDGTAERPVHGHRTVVADGSLYVLWSKAVTIVLSTGEGASTLAELYAIADGIRFV